MKITVNVNIGGISFVMDDDAYRLLKDYLYRASNCITPKEDKDEILSDIERRISELLTEEGITYSRVVTIDTVNKIINIIGDAYIFGNDVSDHNQNRYYYVKKRLMRDSQHAALGGVSSGLAAYIGINTSIIRVLFLLLMFFGGSGFILYMVAWIIIPKTQTEQEKGMMEDMHNGIL